MTELTNDQIVEMMNKEKNDFFKTIHCGCWPSHG